jgi:hypothetical protein
VFSLNIFSALFSPKSNILKYFIHHNSWAIRGSADSNWQGGAHSRSGEELCGSVKIRLEAGQSKAKSSG